MPYYGNDEGQKQQQEQQPVELEQLIITPVSITDKDFISLFYLTVCSKAVGIRKKFVCYICCATNTFVISHVDDRLFRGFRQRE